MRPYLGIFFLALLVIGCRERLGSPDCPAVTDMALGEQGGVRYYAQLQDALQCSGETGRPVLLLFWAYAQSNKDCWDVLADEDVQALIHDRLVLCVLMVDDRKALAPEDLVGFPPLTGIPTTIGERNSLLERELFDKVNQPLFTLVNADFTSLAEPMGYVPKKKPEQLVDWIQATLEQQP